MQSEQRYLARLVKLESQYCRPLRPVLSAQEHGNIFGCLESIVGVHRHLGGALPARHEAVCGCPEQYTAAVISAMSEVLPFLRMYSSFIANFENSLGTIAATELRLRPPTAPSLSVAANRANLEALLIEPVQRIPRYRMLLEELLDHTPPNHTAHTTLESCLSQISALAAQVNDRPRHLEQRCRLLQLHRALAVTDFAAHFAVLDGFALAAPHRRLLRCTEVEDFDPVSGIAEHVVVLLCNDLICKARPLIDEPLVEHDDPGRYELLAFDGLIWLRECDMHAEAHESSTVESTTDSLRLTITRTPWLKNIASCCVKGPSPSAPWSDAQEFAQWHLWFKSNTDMKEWSAAVKQAVAELEQVASGTLPAEKQQTVLYQQHVHPCATDRLETAAEATGIQRSLSAPPVIHSHAGSDVEVECNCSATAATTRDISGGNDATASQVVGERPILASTALVGTGLTGRCSHGPLRSTSPMPDVSWSRSPCDSPHLVLVRHLSLCFVLLNKLTLSSRPIVSRYSSLHVRLDQASSVDGQVLMVQWNT